jgi:hypothetical protein
MGSSLASISDRQPFPVISAFAPPTVKQTIERPDPSICGFVLALISTLMLLEPAGRAQSDSSCSTSDDVMRSIKEGRRGSCNITHTR